jgi:ribonuclease-3
MGTVASILGSLARLWPGTPARTRVLDAELRKKGLTFRRITDVIGYRPRKRELLFEALLHRSFLPLTDGTWVSNERLEFLGDAILNTVVADHVFRLFPHEEEGELTRMRSRLVNRRTLAGRGRALRLDEFLLLSSSATQSMGAGSESMVADAYEAVIGAIYLDGGMAAASDHIHRTLLRAVDIDDVASTDDNYKSALLEYAQANGLGAPRYTVVREEGPEHERRFTIEVSLGNGPWGVGSGRSKKDAEQAAAARAMEQIQRRPASPIDRSNLS